jgi:pimeloyl-ACP methyl ester carboxylesterase
MTIAPPPMPRGGVALDRTIPRVRGRLAPEAMFPAGLPDYRTRFETLRTGERVRVIESGPSLGEPVVFFPGWGCPVWDFHATMPAVAAAGFRAIAVDLRGHGLSDMPVEPDRYTTDAMIAHAIDILDALAVSRAAMIGHSMGGALATHLAFCAPERVRALALFSPIGCGTARAPELGRMLSPPWSIPLLRASLRRSVVAAGLRILYGAKALVTARNVDEYWAPSQFDGFVPAMRALLHGFRWSCFTAEEMSKVGVPGLLVCGSRDPIIYRPSDRVPAPAHWQELVIDGVGHLPHDEAPEVVNRAVVELLTGLGKD